MRYTSDSKGPPTSYARVNNLNVMFPVSLNYDQSWRGQFVEFAKNPLNYFLQSKELLHVLKNISFEAKHGDRIAIIGKNGAGKSTLCRSLAGIYRLPKGCITTTGQVRAVFNTSLVLFPDLTGRENARYLFDLIYTADKKNTKELLNSALEFSGLGRFLDMPFKYYSTGMQSRLCLSLVSCQPADIFILDEVFEAADREFRERISHRIIHLIENSGIVFFVSHSEEQIRKVCNKALWLQDGHIKMFDSVDTVMSSYNTKIRHDIRNYTQPIPRA